MINKYVFIAVLILGELAPSKAQPISRSSFSQDFIFGAGSSAYQVEGATNVDGKGISNWDYYVHKNPSAISDGNNADVANDFYHRYKEDIRIMKEMRLDSFRFSISWTRILPKGNKEGGVNQLGIDFYNNVINELLLNGIKPFVTLYHWDLPQSLEEKYNGFLSAEIVNDFTYYVDICFQAFGDRVKNWVTINEPNIYSILGFAKGIHVPNRCTSGLQGYPPCHAGNSSTEPYIVGHNLLLSHASAVKLYREKYQTSQKGKIGISVACDWAEPYDQRVENKLAAERFYEHFCGWFFNPIKYGDYPQSMRSLILNRLPTFTKEQSDLLKNSFDFLGLNTYTGHYAKDQIPTMQHYDQDNHVYATAKNENGFIGNSTPSEAIFAYPKGIENLVLRMKNKYDNPIIIVTENGYPDKDEKYQTYAYEHYLDDPGRIQYLQQHLNHLLQAIKDGANVKGYFVWSFMDDFEWNSGYLHKFGLNYIDRKNDLRRYMKKSGIWYQNFLNS